MPDEHRLQRRCVEHTVGPLLQLADIGGLQADGGPIGAGAPFDGLDILPDLVFLWWGQAQRPVQHGKQVQHPLLAPALAGWKRWVSSRASVA